MKRLLLITVCLITLSGLQAQERECMRIYTDKDCYLTGEDLWIKVCVTDSLYNESDISKVAYIEISDSRQVYTQNKVALQNGTGWGRVKLPQTMLTNTYQLTAYTRYMRNFGETYFPQKPIIILNVNEPIGESNIEVSDSLPATTSAATNSSLGLSADKAVYYNRSKVTVTVPKLPANAKELTLSVVRKDCIFPALLPLSPLQNITSQKANQSFIAECEGHIVTGKLAVANAASINTKLSCIGKDIRIFDGQPQPDGNTYLFYTSGITDRQDIVLTTSSETEYSCRLEIASPFAGILSNQKLPKFRLSFDRKALAERSIGAQLHHILPADSTKSQSIWDQLYSYRPSSSYNLNEYTRFNTVRETFIEFATGIGTIRQNGVSTIRLLQKDGKRFSDYKALVLLDGVPIEDHETILSYDARLLHYIHQYSGMYTFGGRTHEGIVSLVSLRGGLPNIRLDENSLQFSYEFPQNKPFFAQPVYDSEAQVQSRIPDFRHTLYWGADITCSTDAVSFYTSDMKGLYVITLQGITAEGKEIKEQTEFIVK